MIKINPIISVQTNDHFHRAGQNGVAPQATPRQSMLPPVFATPRAGRHIGGLFLNKEPDVCESAPANTPRWTLALLLVATHLYSKNINSVGIQYTAQISLCAILKAKSPAFQVFCASAQTHRPHKDQNALLLSAYAG